MAIKILCSILVTLFSLAVEQCAGQTGVIKLEHVGDSDKPYYTVIFHLPGTQLDTTGSNMFTIVLEISMAEFNNIKTDVTSNSLNGKKAILNGTYNICIKDTHHQKEYKIIYLEPLTDIFKEVCQDINDDRIQNRLKNVFNQTLYRLGSKNGLD